MEKYTPNAIGNRTLEIIKSYLPHARVFWSTQSGAYAVENPTATDMTRIFFIDMAPRELEINDIAFFITHLGGGRFSYNALKREIAHGEKQRQARARESAEGSKELQREVAHG
jgi:hypothetical protein